MAPIESLHVTSY